MKFNSDGHALQATFGPVLNLKASHCTAAAFEICSSQQNLTKAAAGTAACSLAIHQTFPLCSKWIRSSAHVSAGLDLEAGVMRQADTQNQETRGSDFDGLSLQ